MFKKSFALGLLATSLTAPSMAQPCYFKSGFLAGAHVGVSNGSGTFNNTFSSAHPALRTHTASLKDRKSSAMFGVLGGYRHVFHGEYTVGLDFAVNMFTNNKLNAWIKDHPIGRQPYPIWITKLSRRWNVVPSVNFGKVLCNRWHVALGLGLGISSFQQQLYSPFINEGDAASPTLPGKTSITRLGFAPSISVEYAATQNISVIGNISYEIYKKINTNFGPQFTAPPILPMANYTSSISPRYFNLKVGAVYRF